MKVIFRPLKQSDIMAVYEKPFDQTSRGVALEIDGELAAVGGVLHTAPLQAYSTVVNKKVRNPAVLRKLKREFDKILAHYAGQTVMAIADERYSASGRFLEFFGFEKTDSGVYQWQIP